MLGRSGHATLKSALSSSIELMSQGTDLVLVPADGEVNRCPLSSLRYRQLTSASDPDESAPSGKPSHEPFAFR
jgi:hypothetical protein